jgi:hypothetical protein
LHKDTKFPLIPTLFTLALIQMEKERAFMIILLGTMRLLNFGWLVLWKKPKILQEILVMKKKLKILKPKLLEKQLNKHCLKSSSLIELNQTELNKRQIKNRLNESWFNNKKNNCLSKENMIKKKLNREYKIKKTMLRKKQLPWKNLIM